MKKAVLIINIAAFAVIIALTITLLVRSSMLPEQEAYKRWSENNSKPFSLSDIFSKAKGIAAVPSAQISVFYKSGISLDNCYQMTFDLGEKTETYAKNIGGDAVASAFCTAPAKLPFTAKSDIGEKSANLESYFVGGDFLLFHPYEILSGTFLSDDTIMHDNAVIDENAAWQLFGSNDVVGEYIFSNTTAIHISGVVKIPNAETGYIFLDKELCATITGIPAQFNCFETIMPNPVTGSGLTVIKEMLGITDGNTSPDKSSKVVENSSRTTLPALFDILENIPEISVRDDAIILPAWENRARERDTGSALILFFLCVVVGIVLITDILPLIWLIRLIKKSIKRIYEKIVTPSGRKIKGENE
ncbi:MAG: ABC transporter permease [Ruminococcus sp.]|jgi:hypothetical protein|nr:ABC transporter permease [Ruminococcus sp.]